MDAREVDRGTKGDRRQKREFVRRVDTVDVEARIGLRIAELLRLGQHLGEVASALAHGRKNIVRRPVQDTVDAVDVIGSKTFAQRLDDGDTAGNSGLEGKRDALLLVEPR